MPAVQYPSTIVFGDKLWCISGSSIASGVIEDAYNKNDICYIGTDGVWHILETGAKGGQDARIVVDRLQSIVALLAGNRFNGVYK